VRGGEALDLISSMNTGHSGSMGTVHSNNPKECLTRLETLALMTDSDVPVQAVRAQVAAAINIVVQLSRIADGSRKLTHISEGLGMDLRGNYITNRRRKSDRKFESHRQSAQLYAGDRGQPPTFSSRNVPAQTGFAA
jgi:Flp pilus assembly CpaF family ATPase